MSPRPNGLHLFVKRDCPTCRLLGPVVDVLQSRRENLVIYSQDDPTFPDGAPGVVDDTALEQSYRQKIEVVPTLLRVVNGAETGRIIGWDRAEWQAFTNIVDLGASLPAAKPGCLQLWLKFRVACAEDCLLPQILCLVRPGPAIYILMAATSSFSATSR